MRYFGICHAAVSIPPSRKRPDSCYCLRHHERRWHFKGSDGWDSRKKATPATLRVAMRAGAKNAKKETKENLPMVARLLAGKGPPSRYRPANGQRGLPNPNPLVALYKPSHLFFFYLCAFLGLFSV